MKKLLFTIVISLYILSSYAQNQGINNIWLSGYGSYAGSPFGINRFDFNTGVPIISKDSFAMEFRHTHANISDSSGNILFYTNGYYIADASDDTMQNGTGINPGAYANLRSDGFLIPQGALVIPAPNSNHLYYLFHSSVDNPPDFNVAYYLRYSIIDMNLNGGLGAVTTKNVIVINDTLNGGKISATKHANGRDWWLVVHKAYSNTYFKLLITPYGIFGPYSQVIGSIRDWDAGQAKFSPDGNRYAYFHYRFTGLDLFDFDRCTGLFSNWRNDTVPLEIINVGCAFSPNSNVLYVSNVTKVYQYKCADSVLSTNRIIIAQYDSFKDPQNNFGTYLSYPELASDGKIYITTGNSTQFMHVINNPDSLGLACNVQQHGVFLPALYFNTLPNHPNYFLGKIAGSPCDTVPLNNAINELPEKVPKVMPNPTTGKFTLWFAVHDKPGWAEVYDINGRLIHKEPVAQWSQYKQLDIINEPQGVYLCKMKWEVAR